MFKNAVPFYILYIRHDVYNKKNYQVRGQSYGIRIPVRSGIEKIEEEELISRKREFQNPLLKIRQPKKI